MSVQPSATVELLGVPMYAGSFRAAVSIIVDQAQGGLSSPRLISATSVHGLVTARKDPVFFSTLREFYLNVPDGMPTVWLARLKGSGAIERCYGPAIFAEVLKSSSTKEIKHFFCGGKEGVAERLRIVTETLFENMKCVGTYSPPFRQLSDDEMKELGTRIREVGPDIVWIGLSTPKQELFAKRLAQHVNARFIVTVGAAFDFHTGLVRQAPRWMQRVGLEWLFRLMMEPRRLFRRYVEIVPLFMYYGTIDLWKFWWNKWRMNDKG